MYSIHPAHVFTHIKIYNLIFCTKNVPALQEKLAVIFNKGRAPFSVLYRRLVDLTFQHKLPSLVIHRPIWLFALSILNIWNVLQGRGKKLYLLFLTKVEFFCPFLEGWPIWLPPLVIHWTIWLFIPPLSLLNIWKVLNSRGKKFIIQEKTSSNTDLINSLKLG